PIAWIPFAIVWFGIGDPPAIFIIFLATAFQLALATAAASTAVPRVYYRGAQRPRLPDRRRAQRPAHGSGRVRHDHGRADRHRARSRVRLPDAGQHRALGVRAMSELVLDLRGAGFGYADLSVIDGLD